MFEEDISSIEELEQLELLKQFNFKIASANPTASAGAAIINQSTFQDIPVASNTSEALGGNS